jgi:hypothetical protein
MGSQINFVCPYCGFEYKNLRTKLTYREVYAMLWVGSDDSSKWRYKRRNTVLGAWHQFKMELWAEHINGCEYLAEHLYEEEEVPF